MEPTPQQLRDEITAGPLAADLAADYAAGRDAAVAAGLNARTRRGAVPIAEVAALCCRAGVTGGVMALLEIPVGDADAPPASLSVATKAVLHTVLTLIQLDFRLETVDVDDPAFGAACDKLVSLGVMAAAHRAALLALGDGRQGRADELGWVVTAAAVEAARKGN